MTIGLRSLRRLRRYEGAIDGVIGQSLHGWAYDRRTRGPIQITLSLKDGTELARGLAGLHRADVQAAGHDRDAVGFAVELTGLGPLPDDGWLILRAADTGTVISQRAIRDIGGAASRAQLRGEDRSGRSEAVQDALADAARRSPGQPLFEAGLDPVTDGRITGWARALWGDTRPFDVELLLDGVALARARTGTPRVDLLHISPDDAPARTLSFDPPEIIIASHPRAILSLRTPDAAVFGAVSILPNAAMPRLAGPHGSRSERRVTIIIPVYNAAQELRACIAHVQAHTPDRVDILIIDDCSPDASVDAALSDVSVTADARIRILRNNTNLGYTATCNRGLDEAGDRDVILLNSDTRVQAGWFEAMVRAADARPNIATVTALSDRAGAFSAPEPGNGNELPPGVTEADYATAVRRRALRVYPEVPTGNGFCMLITRACLNAVGPLDAEAFPRGYGEENEFCMRAGRGGWRHVIADDAYVYHDRSASFGSSKTALMEAGRQAVDARFTDYSAAIRRFGNHPALSAARFQSAVARADCTRPDCVQPRVLFVTSTQTGGTPQTNADLMNALDGVVDRWLLSRAGRKLVLSRMEPDGLRRVETVELLNDVEPLTHRSAEYEAVVADWFDRFDFTLVHIRHLVWHSVALPALARAAGAAVVMSFHDYYTICPTVQLVDGAGSFCGGDCARGTGICVPQLWPDGALPDLRNAWVHDWRDRFRPAFEACDAFVTTSPHARERICARFPDIKADNFAVIPHGRDFPAMAALARPVSDRLKILVPGNIGAHKGSGLIQALADIDKGRRFEFHILGQTILRRRAGIVLHGGYARDGFNDAVARIGPNIGAILSTWDETWCHTLTEMWAAGLPVATLDYPTVADRVREAGAGWVLSHETVDALHAQLIAIADDTEGWAARLGAVLRWQRDAASAGTHDMAAHYLAVYQQAIAASARSVKPDDPTQTPAAAAKALPIAVVCPTEGTLDRAPGSTWVRLWERTRNALDRPERYVRVTASELAQAVAAGRIDTALIQRTALAAHHWDRLRPLVDARALRFALDLDDDLFDVPPSKDPRRAYRDYVPLLSEIANAAGVVTVSTDALKARIEGQVSAPVRVVENRLSRRLWTGLRPPRLIDGHVRALYFGTRTHDDDLTAILGDLASLAEADPTFRLRLIDGVDAGTVKSLPDWVEHVEVKNADRPYPAFVALLRHHAAFCDFGFAVLSADPFNAFKSPLKLLETAALGLPVFASAHPVFQTLGPAFGKLVTYCNHRPGAWRQAIQSAMLSPEEEARRGLALQRKVLTEYVGRHTDIDDIVAALRRA